MATSMGGSGASTGPARASSGAAPPGGGLPTGSSTIAGAPGLAAPGPESSPSAGAPPRVRASPVARRWAEAHGLPLSSVHGSGPQGAILRADVVRALETRGTSGAPPPGRTARFDASAMRSAIAAAMTRSKREIPHYYLSTEVDVHRATQWLEARNTGRAVAQRVVLAALLLKATALAARETPEVNGHFVDGHFAPADAVHLGVAINLRAGGLVAPALRDVQASTVDELMARLVDLVERARRGALRATELGVATLTVTNLGEQGVSVVFPVIHPPQVAMVGFGRVVSRPWVVDGLLGPRPIVIASLAADHRVSDGHRGARFLAAIDRLLQTPEAL
ncbi:MAG: 2-oxo acid dehydrogenase subunit E2 [Myxococcaceae bacterium]|nr:2-oxo acid dehydrogenase subunit E2 [Myxococcaceae bacterium]